MKINSFGIVAIIALCFIVVQGNKRVYHPHQHQQQQQQEHLGHKRCTWGPSYWCQHLDSAKECQSVEYCVNQWKTLPVDHNSKFDSKCSLTTAFIQDVHHLMKWYVRFPSLERKVLQRCEFYGHNNEQKIVKCQNYVKKYLKEVTSLLKNDVSPIRIAHLMKMCSKSETDHKHPEEVSIAKQNNLASNMLVNFALKPPSPAVIKSTECDVCKQVVGQLQVYVNKTGHEEIFIKFLHQNVCANLDEYKTECNLMVTLYGKKIYKTLVEDIDPESVCQKLHTCTGNKSKSQLHYHHHKQHHNKLNSMPKDAECDLCVNAVNYVYSYLEGNKSISAIEDALDKVCTFLPESVKSECVELVNTYTPILVHLIESDLPPKTICSALGLCKANKKVAVSEFKPKKIHAAPKKNMPTGVECDVCVYAITFVENEIGSNTSIAAIESALETVCNIFPASFRQECDDFVTEYTPLLVHLIASELPPKQICEALSLCVAKHRTMRQQVPDVPHHHMKKPKHSHQFKNVKKMPTGVECELCVHVFNYVESLIEGNKTVSSVEAALDKVCSFLPKSVVQQCDDLVNQYTPILIHLIVSDLPPKTICASIGMCTAKLNKGVPRHHSKMNPFLHPHSYHRHHHVMKSVPTTEIRPGHHHAGTQHHHQQQQQPTAPVHNVVGSLKPNDLCSNGPQVWCLSRAKAMSCGTQALRVCQKYYWI